MYNIISIIFSILLPMVILVKPFINSKKQHINLIQFIKNNKTLMLIYCLLVIGCLVRMCFIEQYPTGLNVDEASIGYEAFSVLTTGYDRNGNFMPVFLEAWGSGQNVLYMYIVIPFVKILGLSILSVRLPMAIISCITLFAWYSLLKKIKNKKFAVLGLAFLVICPWHIMKSRWGLESNLFPDLMVFATLFLVKFLQEKKIRWLYVSFFVLGLTGYSYGTSYMFLPIFVFILLIYLLVKKYITIKNAIISFAIIFIVSLPIMLYVIINTLDLEQINLFFCTIPKLPVNRYEEQISLFEGNIITNLSSNFKYSISTILNQNDGLIWNSTNIFGMYYLISTSFILIGLAINMKKENITKNIMNIWFIAAAALLFALKETNINRINILIFPIIYYIIVGIDFIITKDRAIKYVITTTYLLMFLLFIVRYKNIDYQDAYVFVDNVEEVIQYVSDLDKDVYIEYSFKEPYIYTLFYTQYNPHEFNNSVEYFDERNLGKFDNVQSFGKYKFYLPQEIYNDANNVYIVTKQTADNINCEDFKITEFEEYVVLEGKN